jgi:integrase
MARREYSSPWTAHITREIHELTHKYLRSIRGDGRELIQLAPSVYSRVHISRVLRKAAQGAGLRDFHFHDLRHHGATMALNKGFAGPIVMQLGGWKTEKMMRRYAAVTDATLRAAAEAVSGNEATSPRKELSSCH